MALNNVVQIYNKYLLQLLTSLKDVSSESRDHVRSVLKAAGVLAIDHESSEYIALRDGELLTEASIVLPGVPLSKLLSGVSKGKDVARTFIALIDVLAATYHASDEVLATQSLRAIIAVQSGSADAEDQVSAIFHDIVHSRLQTLVGVVRSYQSPTPPTEEKGNAFMDALAGSSISTIAKEIADELVDSDLLKDFGTDPTKIDFASLLDPTSKLGGVAKIVSSKLHDQLGSGKLDQGKLMTEVMAMFGKLNTGSGNAADNPLLAQVMSLAGQMGSAGVDAASPGHGAGALQLKTRAKHMKLTKR